MHETHWKSHHTHINAFSKNKNKIKCKRRCAEAVFKQVLSFSYLHFTGH